MSGRARASPYRQNEGLSEVTALFEAGKVVPVIDRSFPLSDCADAFLHFGRGQAQGKVVITV